MIFVDIDKPKILIVDDSNVSRRTIISVLEPDKFEIIQTSRGLEALELVKNMTIDCILLDLLMPELDGFEVLKQLKENNINIPTIVLSADIQDTTKENVYKLGACDFVNKPPRKESLNTALEKALSIKKD